MEFKNILKKVNYIILLCFVALLPFSGQWLTYFIAVLVLAWIFEGNFKEKIQRWKSWKFLLSISIIILNLISIIYSYDKPEGFSVIQTQVCLLLFPLLFFTIDDSLEIRKNSILTSYITGSLVLCSILLYKIVFINLEYFYTNQINLSNLLEFRDKYAKSHIHRSYLSLHLSLAITFAIYLFKNIKNKHVSIWLYIIAICIFSLVIILLNSRAALLVLIFITLYTLIKIFGNLNFIRRSILIVIVTFGLAFVLIHSRFDLNLSRFFSKEKKIQRIENLFSNGNFEHGLSYWGFYSSDTVIHNLIESKYGKALRIQRKSGQDGWSLKYNGRPIYYHKGLNYNISFKYRVIKGKAVPFWVGWWIVEDGKFKHDLKLELSKLDNEWNECNVDYTFLNDQLNPISFFNSSPNSVIDIADIKLTCNDTIENRMFIDQMPDFRLSLWRNAFLVWEEEPLMGFGVGDAKKRLMEVHGEQGLDAVFNTKYYNAHNQFLETAMQTGLIGVIALFIVLAIPIYYSIRKKQELIFQFLIICFINFLFESMLQRLAGVLFFAFWYSYLWFVYYKNGKVVEYEK